MYANRDDALQVLQELLDKDDKNIKTDEQRKLIESICKNKVINTNDEFIALDDLCKEYQKINDLYWSLNIILYEYIIIVNQQHCRPLDRIPRMINKLGRLWCIFSDLRLTQIIGMLCSMEDKEDDEVEKMLDTITPQMNDIMEGLLHFKESCLEMEKREADKGGKV